MKLKEQLAEPRDWWSLRPLVSPPIPDLSQPDRDWVRQPIDAFIVKKLSEQGLAPAPEADRRTLIRRLSFDLLGLPPSPADVAAFIADDAPDAYETLVDRLLSSPHYGERWGRHWLDVVHFGETHGYDKDKLRSNAWPYRDYVIRALNHDKPYSRFVQESIAGDVLFPGTADGIEALGFIAAGPWDFIGHAEVPETKIDGKVARHLDRDDMVGNAIGTFCSLTVQCAQCHNHKFDPIPQADYYRLQAVFAALDRADRKYFDQPEMSERYQRFEVRKIDLQRKRQALEAKWNELSQGKLAELDTKIRTASQPANMAPKPEYGYHSQIAANQLTTKWVQLDLGESRVIEQIQLAGCADDFNNIGPGFGFPVRYKVELADDPTFQTGVLLLADRTQADVPNPGITLQTVDVGGKAGRYVRITVTKLAPRLNDFIFALAELRVLNARQENLASGAVVTALDSIEAPPRWRKTNLVDGIFPALIQPANDESLAELKAKRQTLWESIADESARAEFAVIGAELTTVQQELSRFPTPKVVYAGMIYHGSGTFLGTGPSGGKPRDIQILRRGDVTRPDTETGLVPPGALSRILADEAFFAATVNQPEGARRAALAQWLTDSHHPLTWRSIVNRVWLYHFGRGIVDTPNDFGRMGQQPTHPELLDWLAADFRDHGQSLKRLHRLLVTSAVYRQASQLPPRSSADENRVNPAEVDANNSLYWRMNRRKLEAEAVRDAVLVVAGQLNSTMAGPSFRDFVVDRPEHSPHFEYGKHNPADEKTFRRSVYRFIVRSQPEPFMTVLDCADPSLRVEKRNESVSPLQALAMLNHGFMLVMSQRMAERLAAANGDLDQQVRLAFQQTFTREPTTEEHAVLTAFAKQHGLDNLCRTLFNLNEFSFID